jgi:HPt (histidine-containing phosphotransfer) domain-containing protein
MIDDDASKDSLEKKLQELAKQFADKLPAKIREIEEMLQKCMAEKPDQHNLFLLHRLLHSLAGSAGIFGFAELGQRMQVLELAIQDFQELPEWDDAKLAQIAQDLGVLTIWVGQNTKHIPKSGWLT